MKTLVVWLVVFLAATCANAREVILLGALDAREPAPRRNVASGGTLRFDVIVPGTVDRAKLTVRVWQVANGIALPLGDSVAVQGESDAHGITAVQASFPKVERKTSVVVKFTPDDVPGMTLGIVHVQVFPPVDWSPLERRLKREGPRLVVFGRDPALQKFLEARGFECADNGDRPPDRLDRDTLTLGVLSAQEWAESPAARSSPDGGRLLVFINDSDALPGVYAQSAGVGSITKVTLPVLANLTNDPRAEDLLLQLIE